MKASGKAILRTISRSKGRFCALFAIVALGAGFFAGLASTGDSMRRTVEEYLDAQDYMDFQLVSTLGFSKADADAVRATPGVAAVATARSVDVMGTMGVKSASFRVQALPQAGASDPAAMNHPVLKAGRWPKAAGECVLNAGNDLSEQDSPLGKTLTLDKSDALCRQSYRVVGLAEAPQYLSFTLGNTNIGDGQLSHFMYVLAQDCKLTDATEIDVKMQGAAALGSFTQAYADKSATLKKALEQVAEQRAPLRRDSVTASARAELAKGRTDFAAQKRKAEQELASAGKRLDDSAAVMAENEKSLAQAKQQIAAAEQTLAKGRAAYRTGLQTYQAQQTEAQRQLDTAARQLEQGNKELAAAQQKLEQGRAELAARQKELTQAKAKLDASKQQLDATDTQLQQAEAALAAAQPQVEQARKLLALLEGAGQGSSRQAAALREQIRAFEEKQAQAQAGRQQWQAGYDAYQTGLKTYEEQAKAAAPQLAAASEALDQGGKELATQKQTLATAQKTYQNQKAQVEAQLSAARRQLDSSKKQLDSGEKELAVQKKKLQAGEAQLQQGRQQLASGRADYAKAKADADAKLADAQNKLDDAQKQIDSVQPASWYVLDRTQNLGYKSFTDDAGRMDSLASVFPVIFFLVAGLVALTTMTRMVEEQRTEIGAYKSLGYSGLSIARKYLWYAAAASLPGSLVGVCAGFLVLPPVCWNAYRLMYHAPAMSPHFHLLYALVGCVAAVGATMAGTLAACAATLRESPASLLLPKAPKPGKRIFLEYIRPLWLRMKFSQKVTARNLFRYKKRFVMTVAGIAGCTALLLTGFGIKDSIGDIIYKQFNELYRYNMNLRFTGQAPSAELSNLLDSRTQGWMTAMDLAADVEGKDGKRMSAYLFVPKDREQLPDFVQFRDRKSGKSLPFGKDSVVLSEKLAKNLDLRPGDKLHLRNQAGKDVALPVTGITENYVYHYAYIDPALYERALGQAPAYNEVCFRAPQGADTSAREALSETLKKAQGVQTVTDLRQISDHFNTVVESLDSIVLILILCAGLLSLVVVYSLTNINLAERERELATLKVLGFYNRESAGYIYRETGILTLIGCGVGLALGVWMHSFVITTVEVDMVMFGRNVQPLSYLWSILLTVAFTALVDLLMYPRFRKVDMIGSLKSVD